MCHIVQWFINTNFNYCAYWTYSVSLCPQLASAVRGPKWRSPGVASPSLQEAKLSGWTDVVTRGFSGWWNHWFHQIIFSTVSSLPQIITLNRVSCLQCTENCLLSSQWEVYLIVSSELFITEGIEVLHQKLNRGERNTPDRAGRPSMNCFPFMMRFTDLKC